MTWLHILVVFAIVWPVMMGTFWAGYWWHKRNYTPDDPPKKEIAV